MSTTLLAVDDSKTMRKVLEITFASEDYKTLLAANADEALEFVRAESPIVAVVDAGLGGVSGYDLCQQIKAQAPQTAVLVLSSKQQPYDRGRGTAVGADDFMDKPFDTQQLIDKVKVLVKNAAATPAPRPAVAAPAAAPAAPRAQTLGYGSAPQAAPQKPVVARPAAPRTSATSPGLAPMQPPAKPAIAAPAAASAPAAAAVASRAVASVANSGQLASKLGELGLSGEQVAAVMALSREVVEQVVWEVVPVLAETLIKEEIQRLTGD